MEGIVLGYAASHRGTQVGDGQCASLAMKCLQAAHAKNTFNFGVSGWTAAYVWGSPVLTEVGGAGGGHPTQGDPSGVKAGDIIQFSNVQLTFATPTWTSWESYPHHTAIVEANLGGGVFKILQQNINGNMTVQEGILDLNHMNAGTLWVYQPVAR
jgi:hypothetical protein